MAIERIALVFWPAGTTHETTWCHVKLTESKTGALYWEIVEEIMTYYDWESKRLKLPNQPEHTDCVVYLTRPVNKAQANHLVPECRDMPWPMMKDYIKERM